MAQRYAIASLDEARGVPAPPGPGRPAARVRRRRRGQRRRRRRRRSSAPPTPMKLRSSMTLFARVAPDEPRLPGGARPVLRRRGRPGDAGAGSDAAGPAGRRGAYSRSPSREAGTTLDRAMQCSYFDAGPLPLVHPHGPAVRRAARRQGAPLPGPARRAPRHRVAARRCPAGSPGTATRRRWWSPAPSSTPPSGILDARRPRAWTCASAACAPPASRRSCPCWPAFVTRAGLTPYDVPRGAAS